MSKPIDRAPKLFLILSEIWTMTDPRDLRRVVDLAVVAEKAGMAGVLIGEHVTMGPNSAVNGAPENPRDWLMAGNQPSRYPHPSNMVLLSAIAAATSTLRLVAGAVLSPLRSPLLVAKELATLDLLSRGRLIFIPGVSWQREEYEALGVVFEERGQILDEQLEVWDRLWTEGSPVSFDGKHFSFDDMYIEPSPYRPGGPEMWIGGKKFSPWSVRRAVRYGKGFFPVLPPTKDELGQLSQAMIEAGRDPGELELGAFLFGPRFTDATSTLDLQQGLAPAADLIEAGFSTLVLKPSQYIDDADQLGDLCRTAVTHLSRLS